VKKNLTMATLSISHILSPPGPPCIKYLSYWQFSYLPYLLFPRSNRLSLYIPLCRGCWDSRHLLHNLSFHDNHVFVKTKDVLFSAETLSSYLLSPQDIPRRCLNRLGVVVSRVLMSMVWSFQASFPLPLQQSLMFQTPDARLFHRGCSLRKVYPPHFNISSFEASPLHCCRRCFSFHEGVLRPHDLPISGFRIRLNMPFLRIKAVLRLLTRDS